MDNSVIAKSGWLFRQTTVMKKWRKSWVELYRDGHLKYYESDQSPNADDVIFMPTECLAVKTGVQVEGIQPPEGLVAQCLLSVVASSGKTWIFCGETLDDMRAWQLALEQARLYGMQPPRMMGHTSQYMPYSSNGYLQHPAYASPQVVYPHQQQQQAYYGYPPPPGYMMAQPQHTTVVYQPDRYYYHNNGTDMALGMMAGAALGSMMWTPMLWW